ncbi:MAG TPA: hypothetical protein VIV15_05175 [Anaerolineales bacterium]
MNQFFYEQRGKEKIKDLMNEGMRSQAHSRTRKTGPGYRSKLPLLFFLTLMILEIVNVLSH